MKANVQSLCANIMTLCDRQTHTYQNSNYLSNLLLWACDNTGFASYYFALSAKMLPDGRPLSGRLIQVQRDWFHCELA